MAVDLHNQELLLLHSLFLSESDSGRAHKSATIRGFGATTTTTEEEEVEEEEDPVFYGSGSSGSETGDCCDHDGEDGYIAELTRRMAHYTFLEDDNLAVPGISSDRQQKKWVLSGSPQSTLWSPLGSSSSSSLYGQNGPSREPSPPVAEDCSWVDKLHQEQQRLTGIAPRHQPTTLPPPPPPANDSSQPLTDYQTRAIQFYKLKREQQQIRQQNGGFNDKTFQKVPHSQRPKPRPSSNPWSNSNPGPAQQQYYTKPNQLQPPGSGMRAVFLAGPGARSGSCGTGVFLPRGDRSNPSESRKKTGCSTVLIPARVAQALKLHFDHVGVVSRHNTDFVGAVSDFPMQHDVGKNQNRNPKCHYRTAAAAPVPATNHQYEMGLPQEWTY